MFWQSCKLSLMETICMKCQNLFCRNNNNKHILKCRLLSVKLSYFVCWVIKKPITIVMNFITPFIELSVISVLTGSKDGSFRHKKVSSFAMCFTRKFDELTIWAQREKTYLLTCASSETQISLRTLTVYQFSLHAENLHSWPSKTRPVKILIRLRECAGWSESSLGTYVRLICCHRVATRKQIWEYARSGKDSFQTSTQYRNI